MSTPATPSRRPTVFGLTCGILAACVLVVLVGGAVASIVFGPDKVLGVLQPGRSALPGAPSSVSTLVVVVPAQPQPSSTPAPVIATQAPAAATQSSAGEVAAPQAGSTATSGEAASPGGSPTVFYANPAAATATALAVMGSPVVPAAEQQAGTPAASAPAAKTTPAAQAAATEAAPGTVTREISEAELLKSFAKSLQGMGVEATGLTLKLTGGKMRSSAQQLAWGAFGLGSFNVVGTFVAQKGKVHFVLQEAPQDFAFTSYIEPKIDEMVAALTSDLDVTDVQVQEGKLVVTGTKKS